MRLVCLDGLRGVAALIVVASHAMTLLRLPEFPTMLAVDLFFMISGFIIPYAYEARLQHGFGAWRFAWARFLRLYPLYILGVAINFLPFAVLTLQHGSWHLREPLTWLVPWAILLLPRPVPEPQHSFLLNPPAWSLFMEAVVNALYVLLLPWLTTRVLIAIIIVSGVLLAIASQIFGSLNFGTGGWEMIWGLVRTICPFAIGVLLFRCWRSGIWPARRAPVLLAPGLFMLTLAAPPGIVSWFFVVLLFPVVIWAAVSAVATGFVERGMKLLGELSYPLYALHMPILFAAIVLGGMVGLTLLTAMSIGLIITLVGSFVAGRTYDPLARAFLDRLLVQYWRRVRERLPYGSKSL